MNKTNFFLLFFTLFLLSGGFLLYAEKVNKTYFGSVAIDGKDATAYYDIKGTPAHNLSKRSAKVPDGDSGYSFKWKGANWRFASKASMKKFSSAPEKYVPEYNGFCASALADGHGLVKTDGTVWEFFNDKLYLFYDEDGRRTWVDGDANTLANIADKHWSTLKN